MHKRIKVCFMAIFVLFTIRLLAPSDVYAGDDLSVKYTTHVQNVGWQNLSYDGKMSGTSGLSYRLEGIKIELENKNPDLRIRYQTHVQNVGWQDWKYDGQMSGTSGLSYRLEGIKIELVGAPQGYHIQYQTHVQNVGWQNWVQDGQMSGTSGRALRLEGIRIRIVKEGQAISGGTGVRYQTHVQNVGWQEYTFDGALTGTMGQALRIEAMNIALINPPPGMKVKYQTHVQNIGWQNWVTDGYQAGTLGRGFRIEALKIALEGAPPGYHISYQVHVQNKGWQSWKYDGDPAGTSGENLRIEAIRIRIVKGNIIDNNIACNYTLNDMINMQMAKTPALSMEGQWRYAAVQNNVLGYMLSNGAFTESTPVYNAILNELVNNLEPNRLASDSIKKYQFLKLSYVGGTTVEQLNSIFSNNGVLAGKGQVFIESAARHNINPIYLAAHAILETGNGTSNLARGINVEGVTVYNMFGIGATDSDPDGNGARKAKAEGWTSIDAAIDGGAAWISSGYINNSTYHQDTLYKMRWNPSNPTVHQYATDVKWASNQTSYYKKCFDMIKDAQLVFDIPVYR